MPKGKYKKPNAGEIFDGDSQAPPASSAMEASETQADLEEEPADNVGLGPILKELREFRRDNSHCYAPV